MPTNQRYKLIEGSFSPAEATHVLLALVKSKMDFHNLEKLSNEERFGRDLAHSERRLVELRELREKLRAVCQSAAEGGMRVRVNGWIELELLPEHAEIRADAS